MRDQGDDRGARPGWQVSKATVSAKKRAMMAAAIASKNMPSLRFDIVGLY
jgi:hypothetical protein